MLTVRRQRYGPEHPLVAETLYTYARFAEKESKEKAEGLRREADRVYRKTGAAKRPDNAYNLNNWAVLLEGMGRATEAEPRYRESLELHKKLGLPPLDTVTVEHNLADLLLNRGRTARQRAAARALGLCRTAR
jgi:tetratricopeptide (TPR) repeat protein